MKYCIDTNVLFSYQKGVNLGTSLESVVEELVSAVRRQDVELFMPPRIVEEIHLMVEPSRVSVVQELISHVTVQSPTLHTHVVGAQTLYDLVQEYRDRARQGLHTSVELIRETSMLPTPPKELSKQEAQERIQPVIERLRTRYRNATRTGLIDSLADLDLIFLAKELGAYLVSADEGVVVWGRKVGVREMDLVTFGQSIKTHTTS